MKVKAENQTDALACQMALILITNPFAAPVYLLGLVKDRMCADIMGRLDDIMTNNISDLENALCEMFQLSNHMYTAYDGRCEITGERTTALVREENSSIKAQMSHLS